MTTLKHILLAGSLLGPLSLSSGVIAQAWNPFAKKECTKEVPLSEQERKSIEWKFGISGKDLTAAAFHQLDGWVSCQKLSIESNDGKKREYLIDWLITPNYANNNFTQRIWSIDAKSVTVSCSCRKTNGVGKCLPPNGMEPCK